MILKNLNYIFLCSNVPVPRTSQFVDLVKRSKANPLVFYINRKQGLVTTSVKADFYEFRAAFTPVSFRRLFVVFKFFKFINSVLHSKKATKACLFHVDSFDLYLLALCFKIKFRNVKITYEVRDLHEIQVSGFKRHLFRPLEKFLLRFLDILILTSPKYYSYYYNRVFFGEVHLLENIPDLDPNRIFYPARGEILTIGYVGVIRYPKQILNLIAVVRELNRDSINIKLKVWGGIEPTLKSKIESELHSACTIQYFGAFDYARDVYQIFRSFDILYSVYDTAFPNVSLAIPNKYYEAIFFQKPIIVASNTYLAELIENQGIGIGVDCNSPGELENSLRTVYTNDNNWFTRSEKNLRQKNGTELIESFDASITQYFIAVKKLLREDEQPII